MGPNREKRLGCREVERWRLDNRELRGTATIDFGAAIKGAGGSVDIYDLPEMDIHGNSHVMVMDRNSRQIADLIDGWLAKRKFKR